MLSEKLNATTTTIQKVWRSFNEKSKYSARLRAILTMQKCFKMLLEVKRMRLIIQNNAALALTALSRMASVSCKFKKERNCCIRIQQGFFCF
jgi:hypothetical protein